LPLLNFQPSIKLHHSAIKSNQVTVPQKHVVPLLLSPRLYCLSHNMAIT